MEMIYYTIAAVILYVVSDYILNSIEMRMGKRLPSRSVVFLVIITILAMLSFNLIRSIFGPLPGAQQTPSSQIKPADNTVPAQTQIKSKETKK